MVKTWPKQSVSLDMYSLKYEIVISLNANVLLILACSIWFNFCCMPVFHSNCESYFFSRYAIYDNMLQFCCLSECLDDDMVNSVFQLWIEFDQGCRIDPQRSRVDVSGNNAVFCLRKIQSHNEWHVIKAGFDKDNLDVRTVNCVCSNCEKRISLLYNVHRQYKTIIMI